jgi:hypothetical protein
MLLREYIRSVLLERREYDISTEGTSYSENQIKKFIKFAANELKLKEVPKIEIVQRIPKGTTGAYHFGGESKKIQVRGNGRKLVDILRSLAHELVHHKQKEQKRLRKISKSGIGGKIEDEANAKAGQLIKKYGKTYKRLYSA